MSQSIVLILSKDLQTTTVEACLNKKWKVIKSIRTDGNVDLQVQDHDFAPSKLAYVTIGELVPSQEVESEYMADDFLDEDFRSSLSGHVFFSVTFNDKALCNRVIEQVLESDTRDVRQCWVENENGEVIRADIFLKELKRSD